MAIPYDSVIKMKGTTSVDARLGIAIAAAALLAIEETSPKERGSMSEPNYSGFAEPVDGPAAKAGRNAACPCGSGKKHKKCCRTSHKAVWPTGGNAERGEKCLSIS